MREHKYRGFNKKEGWTFGDLVHRINEACIYFYAADGEKCLWGVDPESVGEYTGIHDSKRTEEYPEGQPIYEGDILLDSGEYHSPVMWSAEYAGWFVQTYDGPEPLYELAEIFVVGNIYENPELLKEGD